MSRYDYVMVGVDGDGDEKLRGRMPTRHHAVGWKAKLERKYPETVDVRPVRDNVQSQTVINNESES